MSYEKPENSSSDSEATESSEDEAKKRKIETLPSASTANGAAAVNSHAPSTSNRGRKKKIKLENTPGASETGAAGGVAANAAPTLMVNRQTTGGNTFQPRHMTAAEMEQHLLQSRQTMHGLPA
mgnify:CR=1 FL=1